jgi:hypothetical protein
MALEGVDLEIGGVDCGVRDSGWLGRGQSGVGEGMA